ncbi:MAG: hypothetical protein ABIH26_07035 [Candidatus Eisenbacteria bacterium]
MKALTLLFLVFVFILPSAAQSPESPQVEAMKRLDWCVGTWKGEARTQMSPREVLSIGMTETIEKRLDGTILVVEGVGRKILSSGEEGDIVHQTFGVLSHDAEAGRYVWRTWSMPGGLYNEQEPAVSDSGFSWSMEVSRGRVRHTVTLDENGDWNEAGEFSRDGEEWKGFFEMVLRRAD